MYARPSLGKRRANDLGCLDSYGGLSIARAITHSGARCIDR